MKDYNEIKKYILQSHGIFFTKDFKERQIGKYFINKLINDGLIERYERGVYLRYDVFEDEYYIIQRKNPTVIYSYNTAMYFHQMTERTPIDIDVTVYTGYNTSHLPKNVNVHFVQKRNQNLGMTKLKTPHGFEVNVYNLERITCDLINERNVGLEKEQINKFLKAVFFEKKIDTVKLIEYAKQLNCEKKSKKDNGGVVVIRNVQSLKSKVRNYAQMMNVSHQQIIQSYIFERFLERVSYSKFKNNFIIKGGCLLSSVMGLNVRSTMDIDTNIIGIHL